MENREGVKPISEFTVLSIVYQTPSPFSRITQIDSCAPKMERVD